MTRLSAVTPLLFYICDLTFGNINRHPETTKDTYDGTVFGHFLNDRDFLLCCKIVKGVISGGIEKYNLPFIIFK